MSPLNKQQDVVKLLDIDRQPIHQNDWSGTRKEANNELMKAGKVIKGNWNNTRRSKKNQFVY